MTEQQFAGKAIKIWRLLQKRAPLNKEFKRGGPDSAAVEVIRNAVQDQLDDACKALAK
jgi:hypothetical protein